MTRSHCLHGHVRQIGLFAGDSGVGHHHVERPQTPLGFRNQTHDRLFVGHIAGNALDRTQRPEILQRRLRRRGARGADHHPRALSQEGLGRRTADAARAAGHDDYPILQTQIHVRLLRLVIEQRTTESEFARTDAGAQAAAGSTARRNPSARAPPGPSGHSTRVRERGVLADRPASSRADRRDSRGRMTECVKIGRRSPTAPGSSRMLLARAGVRGLPNPAQPAAWANGRGEAVFCPCFGRLPRQRGRGDRCVTKRRLAVSHPTRAQMRQQVHRTDLRKF